MMTDSREQYLVNGIASAIIFLSTRKNICTFLRGILSPRELAQVYFRLKIIKMLQRGFTQREVAHGSGVGIATVSRAARELQNGSFDELHF